MAMMDTEEELASEFASRIDALDPHLPALWWHAGHWSQLFEEFEVVHDESSHAHTTIRVSKSPTSSPDRQRTCTPPSRGSLPRTGSAGSWNGVASDSLSAKRSAVRSPTYGVAV
jgi:hypothetical protein